MISDAADSSVAAELQGLIDAFFAAVSFRNGERPDYAKLRDLFVAEGKLITAAQQPPDIASVDDFIQPRQVMVDAGELTSFLEVEAVGRNAAFGNVAHRISTYNKRGTRNGESFAATGVISTQFVKTPLGWRISSMAWDDERPGLEAPDSW